MHPQAEELSHRLIRLTTLIKDVPGAITELGAVCDLLTDILNSGTEQIDQLKKENAALRQKTMS